MDLIICQTRNKYPKQVYHLINDYDWDRIFVVTTPKLKKELHHAKQVVFIAVDPKKHIAEYVEDIKKHLPDIFGEMAVNIVNGNGKDHMALLSAIIKKGISFRFYGVTKNGVEEV